MSCVLGVNNCQTPQRNVMCCGTTMTNVLTMERFVHAYVDVVGIDTQNALH